MPQTPHSHLTHDFPHFPLPHPLAAQQLVSSLPTHSPLVVSPSPVALNTIYVITAPNYVPFSQTRALNTGLVYPATHWTSPLDVQQTSQPQMSKSQLLIFTQKNLLHLHSAISISVDGNFIFPSAQAKKSGHRPIPPF